MRLQDDITPLEAIKVVVTTKGLVMDQIEKVSYVKTGAEKVDEPTISGSYTFSYAQVSGGFDSGSPAKGKDGEPKPNVTLANLITSNLISKVAPQFDFRTNTVYYREVASNMDKIKLLLESLDVATAQVMIEANFVEVTANPRQSYGISWGGVMGSSSGGMTVAYGDAVVPQSSSGGGGGGDNIQPIAGTNIRGVGAMAADLFAG